MNDQYIGGGCNGLVPAGYNGLFLYYRNYDIKSLGKIQPIC